MSSDSKKDWDYIAKVEKAITEKYGKIAIQNPESFWNETKEKDYLNQLKEQTTIKEGDEYERQVDAGGFFIPKKLINKDTSKNCPVCNKYCTKKQNDLYLNKYECCFECYIKYIEGREERWKNGWRPENGREKR